MPWRRYLILAVAVAATGCAEIEFGVGTGGSHAGGAAAGGAGGGGPAGEQCLNGEDDDADGLVDCEDDDCAAFSCVDLPPGWLGPVELRADDSPCDGPFSEGIASLKTKVEAAPAQCTCTCAGIPATCDTGHLTFYVGPDCTTSEQTVLLLNGSCESVDPAGATSSYKVEPDATAGACVPGVDAQVPPATFDARRLCGLPQGAAGCEEGSCAPSASCVYMPGSVVCPSGFATSFMGNAGIIDSRGCDEGSCACGATGTPCSFTLELFDNQNCQGGVVASTESTGCDSVDFAGGGNKGALFTPSAGTIECAATGAGAPDGDVSLNEPITVCCAM